MKQVRVVLLDQRDEYERLNAIAGTSPNAPETQLLKSITNKPQPLKQNPFYGDNIKKRNIPSSLAVGNLRRVELSNYWRMLHTIRGDEVDIICFVLRITDHKTYDVLFGYKKR